jgi:hypothetical protein
VSSCTCTSSAGASCTVTGTTSWSIATLVLTRGGQTVTVTCQDAAMNQGSDVFVVTLTPSQAPRTLHVR